jgi:deoxycytidylate deaminase
VPCPVCRERRMEVVGGELWTRQLNIPKVIAKVANRSDHPSHRHATIVMRGGAVLSVGYNHNGRHSEVRALLKLWPSKRRGASIINLMVRKDGSFGRAKPCAKCQKFLTDNGVTRVTYSDYPSWVTWKV